MVDGRQLAQNQQLPDTYYRTLEDTSDALCPDCYKDHLPIDHPLTCPDCDKAKRHSYSDATTPGFFYDKCEKHRKAEQGAL